MEVQAASVTTAVLWTTSGKTRVAKLPPRVIANQIDSHLRETGTPVCLVGSLPTPEVVRSVSERLRRRFTGQIVFRPVILERDGGRILDAEGVRRLRPLLGRAACVIIDRADAFELCTRAGESEEAAARELVERGAAMVIVRSPADDIAWDGDSLRRLPGESRRGSTGFLAAAVSCRLAAGGSVAEACEFAWRWLDKLPQTGAGQPILVGNG